jgi:hypothetical protein
MQAWSPPGVCGRLLVALALAVPGHLGSVAGAGRCAQAQEANPLSEDRATRGYEPRQVQTVPIRPPPGWKAPQGSDRHTVERLFGESERLTRDLEPKRMPSTTIRPQTQRVD